jgi:4-hydroxymandelate oxidase
MPQRSRKSARPPSPNGDLERCVNIDEVEALARKRMRPADYDYYAGGAEDENTLGRNRAGFARYALLHRVLVDVDHVDTSTEVLGSRVATPIAVAPTAYHCLADREGEVATSRASGFAGALMVASTLSTRTLEDIAEAATGPLWFQLYVYRDRGVTERLIARAEAAGYRALVVTVDTPRLGRRERDLRSNFSLKRGLGLANLMSEGGVDLTRWEKYGSMAAYASVLLDASLTWDSIEWIRSRTKLPIVLKGIVRADDAAKAVDHGVAGVWVSNHGGRQLDGCEATVHALPAVVEAVKDRAEVYVDGGVRRGTDVLKALALGARAVMVGRPVLWGLAAGGERGVRFVLDGLREELALSLALAGCPDLPSVDSGLIVRCDAT